MGLPVVTVASGGLPVVESTIGGAPVTEAANGRGVAVTKVVGRPGMPVVYETIGVGGAGAEATAFLARTSGLDATHTNAYVALINGLVADGIWTKLDVLHIYATKDSTTARLNLVSTSYNATVLGVPPFTADTGYSGVNASSSDYIDTGFNPATAGSPKFVQNSAHVSMWCPVVIANSTNSGLGATNAAGAGALILPKYLASGNDFFRINATTNLSVATTGIQGHFIANRTTASAIQGYKNGSSIATDGASTSAAVANFNMLVLSANSNGTIAGTNMTLAMASIGASLSSTDATKFYNRLRTYMTAVGVP